MTTTIRKSDKSETRKQFQRLAIAAGVTLKDGSPVTVGGKGCPPVAKIKAAIGFEARRMTHDEYSDAKDDYGATSPYYSPTHEGSEAVAAILGEWSGFTDCDGEMSLEDYLTISG